MTNPFEPRDPTAPAAGSSPWSAPLPPSAPPPPPGTWGPPAAPPPPGSMGSLPLYAPPPPPPPTSKRRSPAKLVGVLIGVFALLGATVFAVAAINQPDGASSPEAAVHHLFDSISHRDALGVVESLPANERDVLRDPLVDITQELQRLGVLSSFNLGSVPGAEIRVEDLQLTTSPVAKDVVKVNVVGGSISGHSIPGEIPIGSRLRTIIEKDFHNELPSKVETFSQDLADGNLKLVTVKDGGGWHVSIGYSIAEAIRGDDSALPDFAAAPAPVGSATPDGAVRDLVDAAVAQDARKAVTLMDPNEDRALYAYASLFLPTTAPDHSTAIKVTKLELTPEGNGSTRRVRVGGFAVAVDSDEESSHVSYDGRCFDSQTTYKDDSAFDFSYDDPDFPESPEQKAEDQAQAAKDKADAEKPQHVCPGEKSGNGDESVQDGPASVGELGLLGTTSNRLGITVVEIDGRWYVSPVRTVLDTVVESLRKLQPSDIDKYGKSWSTFFGTDDSCCDSGSTDPTTITGGESGLRPGNSTGITGSDGTTRLPNGAVLNADGSITKADGTVVRPGDPGYDELLDPSGDGVTGSTIVPAPPTSAALPSPSSTSTSTTSTATPPTGA